MARFPSEAITAAESLTKPKHFLTFQIVASVQKSGDVVSKLSVNAMAAHVAAKIGQSDPENVETRIWRPSLPVIHLAAAVAIAINDAERTGRPKTSAGDILFSQSLIEEIVDKAMCYERLIANHRMPIKASKLIKVRIVSK